ncbi:MAG: MEKHLA domain-containing protein [Rhodobacteraceae bacterium]|nr:MEKHLA domain-containing protein [Paracoccaceae bacterium]
MTAPIDRPEVQAHSRLLAASFARLTGQALVAGLTPETPGLGAALFELPLPLVAHGTEADPVFCYANRAALTLWGMGWEAFTRLPSRLSAQAEPAIQADRDLYLAEAKARGWVADYSGIRISATGQRFRISRTILWTVTGPKGEAAGQAALIGAWHSL